MFYFMVHILFPKHRWGVGCGVLGWGWMGALRISFKLCMCTSTMCVYYHVSNFSEDRCNGDKHNNTVPCVQTKEQCI